MSEIEKNDTAAAEAPATPAEGQEDLLQPIKNVEACIEAIVFAAGYAVPYQKLADVTGLGTREVKRLVERIAKNYNNDKHGIMMLKFEKACQFCTKEQYGVYIREALGIRRGGNLSASSMEVLAVVAYNQPVTRAFIDAVRGLDSNYAVNSLIDKELIAPVGRLDAPGRPLLYGAGDQLAIDVDEAAAAEAEADDVPATETAPAAVNGTDVTADATDIDESDGTEDADITDETDFDDTEEEGDGEDA